MGFELAISTPSFRARGRQTRLADRRPSSRALSLQNLIARLDAAEGVPDAEQLQTWLRELRPTTDELAPFVRFSRKAYRRNLVHRHDHFEVLVLCWRPGQHSPIHDHHGSHCGVLVLSGHATEVRFDRLPSGQLRASSVQPLPAGSVTASVGDDLHVIGNWLHPEKDLITLHVYSPPLNGMQRYPDAVVVPAHADDIVRLDPPRVERLAMAHLTRLGEVVE